MSMDRCKLCDCYIDTDDDPDCYQPDPRHSLTGFPDVCVCERCREGDADYADYAASLDAS